MLASLGGQLFVSSIVLLCFYFLPTIIAVARRVRNEGSVVIINLFLGWTLIGRVIGDDRFLLTGLGHEREVTGFASAPDAAHKLAGEG